MISCHNTTIDYDEGQTTVWTQHRLLSCRGCDCVQYEITSQWSEDDRDEYGELVDTVRRYPPKDELPQGTVTILFTDTVSSTKLVEEWGDATYQHKAGKLRDAIISEIRMQRGKDVPGIVLGDGVVGVFTRCADALIAALNCRDRALQLGFELHIGLHAGDVAKEGEALVGGAFHVARRVTDLCPPRSIFVTDTVRGLARTSTSIEFIDKGEQALKGMAAPVRVFELSRPANWNQVVPLGSRRH